MSPSKTGRRRDAKRAVRKVEFILHEPEAARVAVAGDFNGWQTTDHPLERDPAGNWRIRISLAPGTYEYLFVVDGEWREDPACTIHAANPFGGRNCVTLVA